MPEHQIDPVSTKSPSKSPSYGVAIKTIGRQKAAPSVLRGLMRLAESYREKRKLGWSRQWNKRGLRTFQSFVLTPQTGVSLIENGKKILDSLGDVPLAATEFVHQLLVDSERLMGFVFLSEYEEDGMKYETATLSLGRKSEESNRHRDRFDIVLDAPIIDGIATPVARMRLFVDPYHSSQKAPIYSITLDQLPQEAVDLFSALAHLSTAWANDTEKIWDHWSSKYVEYFGDRQFQVKQSHFHHLR